ncbi:YhgE/Pip domain-containing protein [Gelidibacter gilvus]|uniref:Uncharacterized protein n=1 Tax=Gelidibacter gilvus TaxID=59602 RepID=A0A4V1LN55_9FLAO|nr:hypothetical protein [Gelidibacter gilvus]RXJ51106.1 hypothetical protein ESZ48_04310 [Gelidibacter gilvus]
MIKTNNTLRTIPPSRIIQEIQGVQSRLDNSESKLTALLKNLKDHEDLIGKTQTSVDEQWFSSSPSRSELWELIKSDQKSNSETTSSISHLFKSVNANTADLAKMVRGLAQLSCMTYEDLNKSFTEIKENRSLVNEKGDQIERGQLQLNQLIKRYLDRAKNELERELLFNQNIEKIDFALDATIKSVNCKLEELNASIQQVHFLKELNTKLVLESNRFDNAKKKLKLLTAVSIGAIIVSMTTAIYVYIQLS